MPSTKPTDPVSRSNLITFVFDFDKTLSKEYMQEPLFRARGIDRDEFWNEVFALQRAWERQGVKVLTEHVWVEYFLNCVRGDGRHAGALAGLSRSDLVQAGAEIDMYPGVVELLASLKDLPNQDVRLAGYAVEIHVVSTGFRAMIDGNPIAEYLDSVHAVNLVGDPASGAFTNVAYPMSHAGKTTALYEINKGVHVNPDLQVDDIIPREYRHAPFTQMVYTADGPSDAAAWSVMNSERGTSVVVFDPESDASIQQAFALHKGKRVQHMLSADFRPGSQAWLWYHGWAVETALTIAAERAGEREAHMMPGASHLVPTEQVPAWLVARPVSAEQKQLEDAAQELDGYEFGDLYR